MKLRQLLFPNKRISKDLISIQINRDSVCMGDDCESHKTIFELKRDTTLAKLLQKIKNKGYLAQIQGGKATWLVINLKKEIAVVAQQWRDPKYLSINGDTKLSELEKGNGQIRIHFRYLTQQDPDIIYNEYINKTPNE
ncbi:hypothetical protein [Parabacteroides sp. FAFU027]|uniref:hypothetical protein n=1 Tax=Parabacteroides sp. FAFU027 TaxID=2922715 RepID=UPI001FAF9642|nr:hypothetical protein [Parabacteroides sp. FAFU027]